MEGSDFDELAFFRAIAGSGARALLIGRRALAILGLPVLTADYEFWIDAGDAARFNAATAAFGLRPSRSPEEARAAGRYVLENDERVDVLVARVAPTIDGGRVVFDEIWARRQEVALASDVAVALPSIEDLIATKRMGGRPRDAEDIRMLQALLSRGPR